VIRIFPWHFEKARDNRSFGEIAHRRFHHYRHRTR
jgi:hypothetical protein